MKSFLALTAVPLLAGLAAQSASAATYDYYIAASRCSNSNSGTSTTSPWCIDALNSKGSTYAGKRIGFLDGTYDLTNVGGRNLLNDAGASYSAAAVRVTSGTSSSPTVLMSINPRGAIIDGKGASGRYGGYSGSGHAQRTMMGVAGGYVTIDGFKFTGAATGYLKLGIFNDTASRWGTIAGWTVQNNWFDDQVCQFPDGYIDNCYSLEVNNGLNPVVRNNKFTRNRGRSTTSDDHMSAILVWLTKGGLYEHNSAIGSSNFYGKEYYNQGAVIRYNYIAPDKDNGNCIYDFQGGNRTKYPGQTLGTQVYNNVCVSKGTGILMQATMGSGERRSGFNASLKISNNTIVVDTPSQQLVTAFLDSNAYGKLTYCNNILMNSWPMDRKGVSFNARAYAVSGYNVMTSGGTPWRLLDDTQGGPDLSRGDFKTLATYRTAVQAAGGLSASRVEVGTVQTTQTLAQTFTQAGTDAQRYQLASGSVARLAGRSDCTSLGSKVDAGAWGNLPAEVSRIGTNF